jgi:hypothetical protein
VAPDLEVGVADASVGADEPVALDRAERQHIEVDGRRRSSTAVRRERGRDGRRHVGTPFGYRGARSSVAQGAGELGRGDRTVGEPEGLERFRHRFLLVGLAGFVGLAKTVLARKQRFGRVHGATEVLGDRGDRQLVRYRSVAA